jgi:agmatine deiminase
VLTRRRFLKKTTFLSAALLAGCGRVRGTAGEGLTELYMPDEAVRHRRTWMAFGASQAIWGRRLLPQVQRDLATIASVISRYEPVTMLVRPGELELARSLVDAAVELVVTPLDDLWIRDTGPTFVLSGDGAKAAIDFNFNGWGEKQAFARDAAVAAFVAERAGVERVATELVLEGGAIEVDGQGTAIIAESCVLNANRNPGLSRADLESVLMPLLGLDKIIWIPGIRGRDITDGHTDFYARFARLGQVLAGFDPDPESFDHEVTLRHLEILEGETDARGRKLAVMPLEAPSQLREPHVTQDFAAGYVGFYVCNDAVLVQQFGDPEADGAAREAVQAVFPERVIESIAIDGIAAGGGSVHCATQQEPELF